jgi:hypothetical protein
MVRPSTASVVPVTHPAYGLPDQRFGGGGSTAVLVRPVDEPPLEPNVQMLRPTSSMEQRLINRLCVPAGLTPAGQRYVDRRRVDALSPKRPHSSPRPPVLRRAPRGRSRITPRYTTEFGRRQVHGNRTECARFSECDPVRDVGGSLSKNSRSVEEQVQKQKQKDTTEDQGAAITFEKAEAQPCATEAEVARLAKVADVTEAKQAAEEARLEALCRQAESPPTRQTREYARRRELFEDATEQKQGQEPAMGATTAAAAAPVVEKAAAPFKSASQTTAAAPIMQEAAIPAERTACAPATDDLKTAESVSTLEAVAAADHENVSAAEMQQTATTRTLRSERERAAEALTARDELRRAEEREREEHRLRRQPERPGARAVLPPLPAAAARDVRSAAIAAIATNTKHQVGDAEDLDLSPGAANVKQLRLYAESFGASAAAVEAARDDDIPRAALTRLILSKLTVKQLREHARAAGATAEAIEDARDDDSPRHSLTELAVATYCGSR